MRSKVASLLLSVVSLTVLLAGCGAVTGEGTYFDESDAVIPKSQGLEVSYFNFEKAAEAISNRKARGRAEGDYPKVVIAFFDWTGRPAGLDRINALISTYTRDTLGVDVELKILDYSTYGDDVKLMLSSGDHVDLYSTCFLGYSNCINSGYALDLEQDGMFDDYCLGIKTKIKKEYLDACRVGGVLYGTPPIKDYAIETCAICIGSEYLDGIGYDVSSHPIGELGYPKATWDEINDIYAQLHERYPDKCVMATQDNILAQGSKVDNIGGDYYGVLLDPEDSLKVSDVFSSDIFREWCLRTYEWNQAGYISDDALTDDTGASAKVRSGACMAMMASCKPGYKTQIEGECGREMVVFDVGESFMGSSAVSSILWCVNRDTEDPVAALQVLEALYTDPVLENIICWGEEGREYIVNADGTITYSEGLDANSSEYYPNVTWLMPNPYLAHVWQGDPIDLGKEIEEFNDNCSCKSKALGFTWDNAAYAAEYTALNNAYEEFAPAIVHGLVEPSEGIARLEVALKAAGLDRYMAAKQRALDVWAQEKECN